MESAKTVGTAFADTLLSKHSNGATPRGFAPVIGLECAYFSDRYDGSFE